MDMTYSPQVDAPGLWLAPGAVTIGAREIALGTFADFNKDGRLLGIEVLDASCAGLEGAGIESDPPSPTLCRSPRSLPALV